MAIIKELPVLEAGSVADPADQRSSRLGQARPLPPSQARAILASKKPEWLKIRPPAGESYTQIKRMLRERGLHTVCEEAHCPNVAECWASGTATFMLGGDTCTRACRFCAIKTARIPPPLDPAEPFQVAQSIATLGLHYVVLTSVDRDDLEDGGASHFAATIQEIKRLNSKILVEALVPDFRGDLRAVQTLVESGVDVYAHNVETVERLQYRVRDPRANYLQSLQTLKEAKRLGVDRRAQDGAPQVMFTKTSLMLGLGETEDELKQTFEDLRTWGVEILTLGQYLRPSLDHLPVERFYRPEEFDALSELARGFGFLYVAGGPMVRSSYRAGEFFIQGLLKGQASRQ